MTQLGAQMFTVRAYTQTEKDLLVTFRKLREIGYKAVQISAIGADIPVAAVAAGLQENGLTCAATHISFDDCKKDLAAVVEKHRAWGCEYVGIGSMPDAYRADAAGFARFAREASDIADALAKEGLKFVYHNHNFEFRSFGGKTGMQILFEETSPNFQFELDTFWVQKGASDVRAWIEKVRGRMDVVHFKDMALDDRSEQVMAEIGQGNLNWDGILAACRDIGVKWYLVEQDDCRGRDPFESLKISYDFLTSKGVQ
ncbi:MAG: sugar phosphate isomerase/epimerase family protein [Candidatus Spyradocola sp.]|jgi:sugar phosphate isomerase/epimerase